MYGIEDEQFGKEWACQKRKGLNVSKTFKQEGSKKREQYAPRT